jgi:hypothetical protein
MSQPTGLKTTSINIITADDGNNYLSGYDQRIEKITVPADAKQIIVGEDGKVKNTAELVSDRTNAIGSSYDGEEVEQYEIDERDAIEKEKLEKERLAKLEEERLAKLEEERLAKLEAEKKRLVEEAAAAEKKRLEAAQKQAELELELQKLKELEESKKQIYNEFENKIKTIKDDDNIADKDEQFKKIFDDINSSNVLEDEEKDTLKKLATIEKLERNGGKKSRRRGGMKKAKQNKSKRVKAIVTRRRLQKKKGVTKRR